MNDYRYVLEKGSKKYNCKECLQKSWVRYIDTYTGEYLPHDYGRCDHESKCTYMLDPYKDGYAKMDREKELGGHAGNFITKPEHPKKPIIKLDPVYIPVEVLNQTLQGYENNGFIQQLLTGCPFPFDVEDVEKVIAHYRLGTILNGYRKGALTLPYIDEFGKVRAIQVKQFDKNNHTTVTDKLDKVILNGLKKQNRPSPVWLTDYIIYGDKYGYFTSLFGVHILREYPNNPIALVESPKSAIYGTLYFGPPEIPEDFIWLAVYNLSSLKLQKCKALKGRNVFLFPDLSKNGTAFKLWSERAKEMKPYLNGTRIVVSDLLERLASKADKEKGMDIADFLATQDWRKFRKINYAHPGNPLPQKMKVAEKKKEGMEKIKPILNERDFIEKLDYLKNEYRNRKGTPHEHCTQQEWIILDDAVWWYELKKMKNKHP